ncbi:TIGR02186 family protein [Rhodobium gokarnense]|uniref:Uncharacterized protein (TIGR02186 family) n=1 Tax=Rhodobium gokarnense TaxID=364296 RepID=A0ABT3H9M2_9HYPH|nr:TIGR02186 family protein [Rhodobium gokarnense]MCW2307086.1 uncharacterized protein (TIGR02186 family) [Rhodobium gokarnense]
MRLAALLAAACLSVAAIGPANEVRAERLVADISSPDVRIASNFTGTEITVFGSIERDQATIARGGINDVVVAIFGPEDNLVTRRKERLLGIWVNRESRVFKGVPSFYAMHSSRGLDALGNDALLDRYQIGVNHLVLQTETPPDNPEAAAETKEFREAFLRLKQKNQLYAERVGAVKFLSPSLFRTTIPLPANVPVGIYQINVFLFRDGTVLSHETKPLYIHKTGFEQVTYTLAHDYSLAYGIGAVVLALVTGWLAGVIFRKD